MSDDNVKDEAVQDEVVKTVTWERPSGSFITLADTPNFTAFAKENKWKKAKPVNL